MKSTPPWLEAFASGKGPRYLRIVAAVEAAVASGQLQAGDRLPPQRELARGLGLDLTTVSRGYEECRHRGLLETRGPAGTFVAPPLVRHAQAVDLSMNLPPAPPDANLMELLRRGLSQILTRTSANLLMTYQVGGGSAADQHAGRSWLQPMLGDVAGRDLIVCPGSQATLAALIMTLTEPGQGVGCEPILYPGLILAARHLGRNVVTIETDEHGMTARGLRTACRNKGVRMIYLNPTAQNPTAHTMPLERRQELLQAAAKLDVMLVEDDPYWLLAEQPVAPLARLSPEQVCYISTLSKCLTPGLRTAYLSPSPRLDGARFLAALRSINLMSAPLLISLVTQWVMDGTAQRLLGEVRKEAEARRRIAINTLAGLRGARCDGVHLWLGLPAPWTAAQFVRAASLEGVTVADASAFSPEGTATQNAVRVSLGAAASQSDLTAALRRLDRLLHPRQSHSRLIVV